MAEESKKLYRSQNDRWLAGVCGGLAEYFNVDAILIRVLFILFGAAIGGGLIVYLILWIVIPANPGEGSPADAIAKASMPEPEPKPEPEPEPEQGTEE